MIIKHLHRERAVFAVLFTLLLSVAGVTNATAQSFTVGDMNIKDNTYHIWVGIQPTAGGTVSASESSRSLDLYYDFEDGMQGWTAIDGGSPQGYGWQLASNAGLIGSGHNGSSNFMLSKSYDNGYGVI